MYRMADTYTRPVRRAMMSPQAAMVHISMNT